MLAAKESPEVAQEHERHAAIAPVVPEAVQAALGSGSSSAESAARSMVQSWSRIASALLHSNFIGFSTLSALITPLSITAA